MKKMLGLFVLLALSSVPAFAQFNSPRVEVGGGYAYESYNAQFISRANLNGWFATADFNVNNYIGIAADFDGTYGSIEGTGVHQYTYMFGPRIYPMGHHKFTPFVHALFGGSTFQVPNVLPTDTAFAFQVGGGVDVNVMPHIAIRAGEFDYEQTRNFDGGQQGNPNQNNFKFKAGVIFHF